METEFIVFTDKLKLTIALEKGNKDAIRICIDEIQRLESIIRDYEIVITQARYRYDSRSFKSAVGQTEQIDKLQ